MTPSFPDRWRVSNPVLIAETFSSHIWKVAFEDGRPGVVKALKPFEDVADELRGRHLLRWRRGEGLVKLYGVDGRRMLIEYVGERLLAAEIDTAGDTRATAIAAAVMRRLHASSTLRPPTELQPLRERFKSLFNKAAADRKAGGASPYVEAARIAGRLLDNQLNPRPLHGDLHHDNILLSARGWLAVDPKGLIGDPCFDAANMFYNPLDRDDLRLAPERVAAMATTFSNTLGRDPRTILDHAIAYGCLSAAWHHEGGNRQDEDGTLAVSAVIRAVRVKF
ncbi:MAG: aminoglycoside phosphotransferase family protein [Nitratireductor sp.]